MPDNAYSKRLFGQKPITLPPGTPLPTMAELGKAETAAAKKVAKVVNVQTAEHLRGKNFPEINYIIPGYIAEGLTLLCARPKVGKSWLMLDAALAIAAGGDVLGQTVTQGDALYLALEDNERRLKSRIHKILGPAGYMEWPTRFNFQTEWPRANEGGIDVIQGWLKQASKPRLVVVDVLQRFRAPQGRDNAYQCDYDAMSGLQALAGQAAVAIVVIHHLRKSPSESGDPFDEISGTLGLSGAADTALIIRRNSHGATLYGRGRDIEEIETAIQFDPATCRWKALGPAAQVQQSDERQKIIDAMRATGKSMTPTQIADATGMKSANVRFLIYKMVGAGTIRGAPGGYMLPESANAANALTQRQ